MQTAPLVGNSGEYVTTVSGPSPPVLLAQARSQQGWAGPKCTGLGWAGMNSTSFSRGPFLHTSVGLRPGLCSSSDEFLPLSLRILPQLRNVGTHQWFFAMHQLALYCILQMSDKISTSVTKILGKFPLCSLVIFHE